jgi:hypothetical protein
MGSHHNNICHKSIISIISQEPKLGLSMHHVHPSKISPLALANITKETGQGKEYL